MKFKNIRRLKLKVLIEFNLDCLFIIQWCMANFINSIELYAWAVVIGSEINRLLGSYYDEY